ncbi:hypothetical protein GCM10025768_05380 [Microbacterium pseudoresistens]|uniref:Putative coiled-coil protein SlyX n=1 Tax=Microbacterium pseudoresistens TaxID=640634 RepID=A0A7Y9EUU8_9MICO|nr:DUF4407 domain-containing protein [Microbacterium pseudoresistens]NYD54374.1 putative coiled-coil protein SlyX [Microbacterium pseudoresistens]
MSYSAHRPGRLDSQGQISVDAADPDSGLGFDDSELDFLRDYTPTGSEQPAGADDATPETTPIARAAQPVVAEPAVTEPAAEAEPAPRAPREPRARASRAPRERTPGSMLRRLAILGGADGHILDRVPTEQPRFVQMFFVLAGTALVSALSMLFALTTGVQVLVWLAIPISLVWAALIFNLDRFLTSTMSSTRSIWRLIGLAIPRVIMAALIGFVVAEPVVLQVFHNDISREVAATNIVQAQDDQAALDEGPEKQALDAASARLQELQTQATTGIVAGAEGDTASQTVAQSTVDKITAQLAEQQAVIDQARQLYQCELTGEGIGTVPGCTGVEGEGASSDAAHAQLTAAQATYDDLAGQLRDANEKLAGAEASAQSATSASEGQNRQQAKDQLPAARDSYDAALAAYNARAASVADGNAGAIGLLSQIQGLNRLAEKDATIFWAHWLIAALFFMIELLPVLVKVLTSYGDPSLYEKAAAVRKQVDLDRVNADGFRDRATIVTAESRAREGSEAVPV